MKNQSIYSILKLVILNIAILLISTNVSFGQDKAKQIDNLLNSLYNAKKSMETFSLQKKEK